MRKISVVKKKKKVPLCLSAKVLEVQTWPQNNHLSWDDRHRSEIVNITHRDVFQPVVIFGERVQPHPGIVTVLWSNNCRISEAPELCQLYEECWNECQVFSCCTKTWLMSPPTQGGGGHCFSKFPQLRSVLRQSVCWFVVYLLHWKKPAGSRISGIDRCVATWIGKMVKELMARPTKAESDRFSGCGIKPRGSGAGEIVPAGRDRGRRDKAHSNSLLDAH